MVTIRISPILLSFTNDQKTIMVDGKNVGQCLNSLQILFPQIKAALFDNDGKLRSYIEIFCNRESTFPEQLEHHVYSGDELDIVVVIPGG